MSADEFTMPSGAEKHSNFVYKLPDGSYIAVPVGSKETRSGVVQLPDDIGVWFPTPQQAHQIAAKVQRPSLFLLNFAKHLYFDPPGGR